MLHQILQVWGHFFDSCSQQSAASCLLLSLAQAKRWLLKLHDWLTACLLAKKSLSLTGKMTSTLLTTQGTKEKYLTFKVRKLRYWIFCYLLNPRLCHVIFYHWDKKYPCIVGIRLIALFLTSLFLVFYHFFGLAVSTF